jgi:hypothetical protein
MKQLFLVAAIAVGAAGCADGLSPIQIGNALPVDENCEPSGDDDTFISRGSMDISRQAIGLSTSYPIPFRITSNLEAVDTVVGDSTVGDLSRNRFIVEEVEVRYTSTPEDTYAVQRSARHAVIEPAGGEARMFIELISPKAFETASQRVLATGEPVTLLAHFRVKGKLGTGQSAESNEASFPITIYDSGFTGCGAGHVLANASSCAGGAGLNGAGFLCEAVAATP